MLRSYDDLTRPYPLTAHYRRPDYFYHQNISVALLQTCRRIYCETHDLPLTQNEHVFWCTRYPGPPVGGVAFANRDPINNQVANSLRIGQFFKRLTQEQRSAVGTLHFFATVDWFEHQFPEVCRMPEVQAQRIKMTIRHADWRWYPGAQRDGMDISFECGRKLGEVKRLEQLEIQVEAMKSYEDQLITTAEKIFKWRFALPNARVLNALGKQADRMQYESRLNHRLRFDPAVEVWHCACVLGPESVKFTYVMINLVWKAKHRPGILGRQLD